MFDLTTKGEGFHLSHAYFLAQLSKLAYLPTTQIRRKLAKMQLGFECPLEVIEAGDKSGQGYILKMDNNVFVVFRGTELELEQWVTQLEYGHDALKEFEVHASFLHAQRKLWPHIVAWLHANARDCRIWITGHSLGGALANLTLAQIHLNDMPFDIAAVYTFGAPRSVDQMLASKLNQEYRQQVFRIIYDDDLVPQLPPDMESAEALDFSHFGTLIRFDDIGNLYQDGCLTHWQETKPQKQRLISQIIHGLSQKEDLKQQLVEHKVSHYINCFRPHLHRNNDTCQTKKGGIEGIPGRQIEL